jgi:hypothetical protein
MMKKSTKRSKAKGEAKPAAVSKRRFGAMRGKIRVGKAFHDSLPESELKRWE